jgi:acyl carrier protein
MFRAGSTELTAEVRTIISEFAYLDDDMTDDDLLNLDSLNIAELLAVVEDEFGADVAAGFTEPDVRTIRSITAAIERWQGSA